MDCVYRAYLDYLKFLGLEPHEDEHKQYLWLKSISHDSVNDFVSGGVTPYIIDTLSMTFHEMQAEGYVLHPEFDLRYWMNKYKSENDNVKLLMAYNGIFAPELTNPKGIKPFPAIYLLLQQQHAIFSEKVPAEGMPIMAISLYIKENKNDQSN